MPNNHREVNLWISKIVLDLGILLLTKLRVNFAPKYLKDYHLLLHDVFTSGGN